MFLQASTYYIGNPYFPKELLRMRMRSRNDIATEEFSGGVECFVPCEDRESESVYAIYRYDNHRLGRI